MPDRIFSMTTPPSTGRLDGHIREHTAQAVESEGGEGLALHILGDHEERRTARFAIRSSNGKKSLTLLSADFVWWLDLVWLRRLDDHPVVDAPYPWGAACCPFGGVTLRPGPYRAGQDDGIVVADCDVDMTGIEVRITVQCLDDAPANITLGRLWRHFDVILDAAHAADVSHHVLRALALDQPLDLAREADVAIVNHCLDTLWNAWVELQRPHRIGRDVSIRSIDLHPNHDVIGDGPHAADAFDRALSGQLTGVAVDKAGEGDHPVLGGDAHRAIVHLWLPIELAGDGVSQPHVRAGQACSCHECAPSVLNRAKSVPAAASALLLIGVLLLHLERDPVALPGLGSFRCPTNTLQWSIPTVRFETATRACAL